MIMCCGVMFVCGVYLVSLLRKGSVSVVFSICESRLFSVVWCVVWFDDGVVVNVVMVLLMFVFSIIVKVILIDIVVDVVSVV